MNETLTHGQNMGQGVAVAGATPVTTGAAPATRPGAPARPEGAPPPPRKGGQGRPGVPGQPVAVAPAAGEVAPAAVAAPQAGNTVVRRGARWLAAAALIGMIPVTIIGFAASYSTLAAMAEAAGFAPWLAPWIPVGIDGAIIGFLALDLYLTGRRIPWPLLRFGAHAMTAATVVINAAGGTVVKAAAEGAEVAGPVRVLWHALMPVLFVVGVEGARRLIVHAAQLEDGTASDRVPLHRWVLSPIRTGRLYRRMRLAVVRSYPEMVEREQALEGYRVWLTQELGGDLSKATEVQLLPMTMAPRGYTVEEALALPAKWKDEAAERARAEAERERVEAERLRRQAKEDRLRELEDVSDIKVAEHQQAVRTETAAADAEAAKAEAESAAQAAKVAAEHRRRAAERQSLAEAQALESAEAAAARRKMSEDKAEAERAEAEAERQRAEKEKAIAEAARQRAAAAHHAEAEVRANAEKKAAEQAVAEAARAVEAARYETAMVEARAQQAEDYARLTPRERSERQVARMILAAGGDPEAVPLSTIMDVLNVKQTAAGDIRKAALDKLDGGYRPTELETLLDVRA
ncbi:DUF2637 domain-containing protein (plasmid) [Streptomyces sp. NBC_01232]|uniref:DUF2637 domain-containing protein n=1 Tax=Streptomyces sp. NBC_01232 TaxID=2903786 RepID=UPI002E167C5D|nr:DUF2637 domain-containing protein [Streptomyces sp. NBC_01232]